MASAFPGYSGTLYQRFRKKWLSSVELLVKPATTVQRLSAPRRTSSHLMFASKRSTMGRVVECDRSKICTERWLLKKALSPPCTTCLCSVRQVSGICASLTHMRWPELDFWNCRSVMLQGYLAGISISVAVDFTWLTCQKEI